LKKNGEGSGSRRGEGGESNEIETGESRFDRPFEQFVGYRSFRFSEWCGGLRRVSEGY